MSLKDLLEPIKTVKKYSWDVADEWILRQYTKLTKKWEDKGRSRYSLANIFGIPVVVCFFSHPLPQSIGVLEGFYIGTDFTRNTIESFYKKDDFTDGTITINHFGLRIYKKIADHTRLPSLAIRSSLLVKGVFELVDYFKTSNADSLSNAISDLFQGYIFAGTASSMYIKDSNPKILDKQPFWKIAYEKIKEKINVSPQPVPQPVPIQSSTLEDYI